MGKSKTVFEFVDDSCEYMPIEVEIIGKSPKCDPYLRLNVPLHDRFSTMYGADLERFAVNILKALKSKRLKP